MSESKSVSAEGTESLRDFASGIKHDQTLQIVKGMSQQIEERKPFSQHFHDTTQRQYQTQSGVVLVSADGLKSRWLG